MADSDRKNCWEFMNCGRGPGGNAQKQGVCPAATDTRLNHIHGGTNAGRACWVIAGTLCGGQASGTFARGGECYACDFYKAVTAEEMEPSRRKGFMFTTQLLKVVRQTPAGSTRLAGNPD